MFTAAAVREDSEQYNAHHGKAWHQVQVPGWATRLSSNDTNDTNWDRLVSFESFDDNKNRRRRKRSSSNDTNDTNLDRLVSFESFDDNKKTEDAEECHHLMTRMIRTGID